MKQNTSKVLTRKIPVPPAIPVKPVETSVSAARFSDTVQNVVYHSLMERKRSLEHIYFEYPNYEYNRNLLSEHYQGMREFLSSMWPYIGASAVEIHVSPVF